MKPPKILLLILSMIVCSLSYGQTYFSEDFESFPEGTPDSSSIPNGWKNVFVSGTISWEFRDGGHTTNPSYPYTRKPYPAHGGVRNALFQKESFNNQTTKFVTRPIDLNISSKPVLDFWHAQARRFYFNSYTNDELRVYYKTSSTGDWVKIAEYTAYVNDWTHRIIPIPDSAKSSTFYLAFEGKTKPGWGACVDDIRVVESDTIPKSVQDVLATNPFLTSVGTSTELNPVLRILVKVKGSIGTLDMDSLVVTSQNSDDLDVASDGLKLFASIDSTFTNLVPLDTVNGFSSGKATFKFHYSLPQGYTYLYVCYDISSSATVGNTLDAKIEANALRVNGFNYPSVELDPSGSRILVKSIFYDGFEAPTGWILTGDFQMDSPQGLGGLLYGNPDPYSSFAGQKVLGNDLIGSGAVAGDYESSQPKYSATSPTINCKYYKNVQLRMRRWLNVDNADNANIDLSKDGGTTWTNIFTNSTFVRDKEWNDIAINLTNYADRVEQLKIRFTLGPTNDSREFSGWNVDNFDLTGEFITKDVGVIGWDSPLTGCGHTTSDSVRVWIKNFASVASYFPIPLVYSFDNGITLVRDTCNEIILPDDSLLYTFKITANLSNPDFYENILAYSDLQNDDDTRNDGITTSLIAYPTYSLPALENFDGAKNFWKTGGDNISWEWGTPASDSINTAASEPYVWKTALYGYYNDYESSYLESPCFNINDTSKAIVELKYYSIIEQGKDGAALYYSIDAGTSWNIVPKHTYPWHWNWYSNDSIEATGNAAWDTTTSGWNTAKQVLPSDVMGLNDVRFRVVFNSNDFLTYDGWAFDDFKVYKAPLNITIDSISSHHDACQYVNPQKISFHIKNNGIRSLVATKDTIFAAFKINNLLPVIDTIIVGSNIGVGQSATITFNKKANIDTAGTYAIKVYHVDKNKGFYETTDNDTVTKTIDVYLNPSTGLVSRYASARLDTLIIVANQDTTYLFQWANSGNSNLSDSSKLYNPPTGINWLKVTYDNATQCNTTDTFEVVKLIPDVGVSRIAEPADSCSFSSLVNLKVTIKNLGTDTLPVGDSIMVHYFDPANAESIDTFTLASRFKPGDSIQHLCAKNSMDFSFDSAYNVKAFTVYKYDSVPANDSAIKIINAWGYPTVTIGVDRTVAGFDTIRLNGNDYKTFLWNDNTTDSFYVARFIGDHWVRVTDIHDCPKYDTAVITVVAHDIKPTKFNGPLSSCSLSNSAHIDVEITNTGTDTLMSGEKIYMRYKINDGSAILDSVTLVLDMYPGNKLNFAFSQTEDFSSVGNYSYKIYCQLAGDIDATNDTIIGVTSNFGYPQVNLGNDTTVKTLSYLLNAGTGSDWEYLWRDNSVNQTLLLDTTTQTWVTVTDTLHNCASKDTITVTFDIRNGSITNITMPITACDKSLDQAIVEFTNEGNVTIPSGDTIIFGYKVNGIQGPEEYDILSSGITSLSTHQHIFNNIKNYLPVGSDVVKFYCHLSRDLIASNDSMVKSITIYYQPIVNFGGNANDSIITVPPYKLHAPSGANMNYVWQDINAHDSVYTVTTSGRYYITATNTVSGCYDRDTVDILIFVPDGGITNIEVEPSICVGQDLTVNVTFTNIGTTILPSGSTVGFVCRLNNDPDKIENRILTQDLLSDDTLVHTFVIPDTQMTLGSNSFKFFAIIDNDINASNDTSYGITTVNTLPNINLEYGLDTVTDLPGKVLSANLGSGYNYLWHNGQTTESITIDSSELCSVLATSQTTLCSNSDTIYVKIIFPDAGITNVFPPAHICLGVTDTLQVELSNLGTTDILSYENVSIECLLNDTSSVFTGVSFSSDFFAGNTLNVAIPGLKSLLVSGVNTLKVISHYDQDLRGSNDTFSTNITAYPLPLINFDATNDSIISYPNRVVNTGLSSGYSFLWSTGSTNDSIVVNSSGYYNVKVTNNTTTCESSDTVYVKIRIPDGGVSKAYVPANRCYGNFNTFKVRFENFGNETLPVGTLIRYVYELNGSSAVIDSVTTIANLFPGDTLLHTFTGFQGNLITGSNNFKVYTILNEDIYPSNDTMDYVNSYNPLPMLDLGNGNDTIGVYPNSVLSAKQSTGSYTYLWTGGSTIDTLIVNADGKYGVTVINTSTSCENTDSVFVNIRIPNGGITKVYADTVICDGKQDIVSVRFANLGNESIASGQKVKFAYILNNTTPTIDSVSIVIPLAVNDTLYHSFIGLASKLNIGENSFKFYSILNEDIVNSDDTVSYKIVVNDNPIIGFGTETDSLQVIKGGTISAYMGIIGYSYLWNTGSVNDSIVVNTDGWYPVKVTKDATSCNTTDSVYVSILIPDGSISKLYGKQVTCKNEFGQLTARFTNNGNYALTNGSTIRVSCKVNGNYLFTDTITLSTSLNSADTLLHTITGLDSSLITGNNTVVMYSGIDNDLLATNDTLSLSVLVNALPVVDIGGINDTLYTYEGRVLNASQNASGYTYLWQDGATTDSVFVDTTKLFKVTVTNSSTGCYAIDSVYAVVSIPDGSLTQITGPSEKCEGTFDSFDVEFTNTGNQKIFKDDTIQFKYSLNGMPVVTEAHKVITDILPGGKFTHTFAGLTGSVMLDSNEFRVSVRMDEDIHFENDSGIYTIIINPNPVFDLGSGSDSISVYVSKVLKTGLSANYSFLWSNDSTADSILVDSSGVYKLQVTNDLTSCYSNDSVYVEIRRPDFELTTISGLSSACKGIFDAITLHITNNGNLPIKVGSEIPLQYSVNNGTPVKDTIVTSQVYDKQEVILHVINSLGNKVSLGSNSIQVQLLPVEDVNSLNDTNAFVTIISEKPEVIIDEGADTIVGHPGDILHANKLSDCTYLWNTGETSDSITLIDNGKYIVEVTNTVSGCKNSDSIIALLNFPDGVISKVTGLTSLCEGESSNYVATFINNGDRALLPGSLIKIGYSSDLSVIASEELLLLDTLKSSDSLEFVLQNVESVFSVGLRNIKVYSILAIDVNHSNDTASLSILINSKPIVNLGDTIIQLPPVILNAGPATGYSYIWNDNSTSNTLEVLESGKYYVDVTDNTSLCKSTDTVVIVSLLFNGSLAVSVPGGNLCSGSDIQLTMEFTNAGTSIIKANDTILIDIVQDEDIKKEDTLVLSNALNPGDKVTRLINVTNLLSGGNNELVVVSHLEGDNTVSDDSVSLNMTVLDAPEFNIEEGKDSIQIEEPFILAVGLGNNYNYTWNTGELKDSITVSNSGIYKVTVEDKTTSCKSTDSIYVILVVGDIAVVKIYPQTTICKPFTGQVEVELQNVGNITYTSSDLIDIKVKINNGTEQVATYSLPANAVPGSKFRYSIPNAASKLIVGSNTIKVYSEVENDADHTNDTLVFSLVMANPPAISLANGKDTTTFTTSAQLDAGAGTLQYKWNTGSTSRAITINTPGWYSVVITNTSGCSSKDSVYMRKITSVSGAFAENAINTYPNPAKEKLTVELINIAISKPLLEVVSVDMKVVYRHQYIENFEQFREVIDVKDWEKGIYLIRLIDASNSKYFIKQIIVQ